MKLDSPNDLDLREVAKDVDWTVGATLEDFEATEKDMNTLETPINRSKDAYGQVDSVVTFEQRSSGTEVRNFKIDFALLQKVLYEHRRYAAAQGFSDPEMDVLRAIEFHDREIAFIKDIMEDPHCEQYSESSIYRSLRELREKELISKVNPGAYEYTGP